MKHFIMVNGVKRQVGETQKGSFLELADAIMHTPPKWVRHRFHANLEDYRPMTFPPPGPYWCSGTGDDHSIVIAYLPVGVQPNSKDLWPEASHIESEPRDAITYTDRFPKPSWWNA